MHTCAHTHTHTSFTCAQPSHPYLWFVSEHPSRMGMFSLTGMSSHSGADEKALSITSTLDLKVWTRLEEKCFVKRREKKLGANSSKSNFIKWSFPEEGVTWVILTTCRFYSFLPEDWSLHILFSMNVPPSMPRGQGLPLEGEPLHTEWGPRAGADWGWGLG